MYTEDAIEKNFIETVEKFHLINAYLKKDLNTYNKLLVKYPEYEHIELFIKISEKAFIHFKDSKYCSFDFPDNFFSLIDCTFKGYDSEVYITSENPDIDMFPLLNYDRSCMLYIEVPEDFDEDPNKYKDDFILQAIKATAENYLITLDEDAKGLSGQILPNPNYIKED